MKQKNRGKRELSNQERLSIARITGASREENDTLNFKEIPTIFIAKVSGTEIDRDAVLKRLSARCEGSKSGQNDFIRIFELSTISGNMKEVEVIDKRIRHKVPFNNGAEVQLQRCGLC